MVASMSQDVKCSGHGTDTWRLKGPARRVQDRESWPVERNPQKTKRPHFPAGMIPRFRGIGVQRTGGLPSTFRGISTHTRGDVACRPAGSRPSNERTARRRTTRFGGTWNSAQISLTVEEGPPSRSRARFASDFRLASSCRRALPSRRKMYARRFSSRLSRTRRRES